MRLKIEFQENNISTYPKISADCRQNFDVTTDVPWRYVTKDVPSVYSLWDIPNPTTLGYPINSFCTKLYWGKTFLKFTRPLKD